MVAVMGAQNEIERRLQEEIQSLGIHAGEVLLVHSSMKSVGGIIPDGPDTVIRALFNVIGTQGTLCFPALSYENVNAEHPEFDVRNTPSNVGILPEAFRLRFAETRSLHPTHSVCVSGPLAEELTARHGEDTTPCGPHSPFSLLPGHGAKLLMLGCGLRPNTTMHAIEEHVKPEYLWGPEHEYTVTDKDGQCSRNTYQRHGFKEWEQRYDRIETLLPKNALNVGKVLEATCHLVDLAVMWEIALYHYRKDPLNFVEPK